MEPGELLTRAKESRFLGPVFRAIYTSFPAKNLFSDLGFREGDPDLEILQDLANQDSGIDPSRPQQERPFQYGDLEAFLRGYISEAINREELLYPLRNAQTGRFSDGTHAVFYAALEEDTALAEVVFHFLDDCAYDLEKFPGFTERVVDKRVVRLDLDIKGARDFRPLQKDALGLTAESYVFCQELGRLLWTQSIPMALVPSARAAKGTTTPIFNESALPSEPAKTLRYYHLRFHKAVGLSIMRSDLSQTSYTPPPSWTFEQKLT